MSEDKLYLYQVWVRIWHWLNAISFMVLIISGLSMQYSSPEFPILPFALSVTLHNISGVIVLLLLIVFIIGNQFTKNGIHYVIQKKNVKERLLKQARYYLFGIFKGEKSPFPITAEQKFNPLQRFAYIVIMYICMPLLVLTGVGLFFPTVIPMNFLGMNGILLTAILHSTMGFICSLFLVVHVYLCTLGSTPGAMFTSMITGYHE